MSELDNTTMITALRAWLLRNGFEHKPGTFLLNGDRRFRVDVGSSYREVQVRMVEDEQTIEKITITKDKQAQSVFDTLALCLQRYKAKRSEELHAKYDSDDRSAAGDGGWSTRIVEGEGPIQNMEAHRKAHLLFKPCVHGNTHGECVLIDGHEDREQLHIHEFVQTNHIDRWGKVWNVEQGPSS